MEEQNRGHNPNCQSDSFMEHLCYIISQGFHLSEPQEYETLVKEPHFKCKHCKRVANSDKNLCEPFSL